MARQTLYLFVFVATLIVVAAHRRGGKTPASERAPFLRGLDQSHYDDYHKIIENSALTKKQFRDAVDAFAAKLPDENKKLYTQWKARHEAKATEANTAFASKIATLSPEAQNLAKQIKAIHDNLDITRAAEKEQIHKIRSSASESVRKELKGVLPHGRHGKKDRKSL